MKLTKKNKVAIFVVATFSLLLQTLNSQEDNSIQKTENKDVSMHRIITYIDSPKVEQRQVITKTEIENSNSKTLTELLESSGIQIKSYGSYGNSSSPSIRGFTGSTIKVVINGICVNSAQNGTFDFSTIDVDSIEKIEIVKGSFIENTNTDGGSGTIFITTKKQSLGHNFFINSSAKTFFYNPVDTVSLSFRYDGQISENTFLKTNSKAVYAKNEFMYKNYRNLNKLRKNNTVKDGNISASLSHFFSNGNSFTFSENFYTGNKQIPGPENSTSKGIQIDNNNNLSFDINFPQIANNIKFMFGTNWISNNQQYEENNSKSLHYLNTVNSVSSITHDVSDFFNYSFGFQIKNSFINSTNIENNYLIDGFIKSTATINFNKNCSLIIPFSVGFWKNNFIPIPKIGIKINSNNLSILFNINRIYLFPDMNQLYWKENSTTKGNPNLKPEDGINAELTFDYSNNVIPFSLCFFTNYYFNKIQWQCKDSVWSPENVSSAFYAGINLNIQKTLFNTLTLKLNYEYLYNSLLEEGITYKKRIMYTPEHVCSFSVLYDSKLFNIYTDFNFVSKRYTSNLNNNYLEPYLLINLSAQWNQFNFIKPYIKLNNILNQDYEQTEDYPLPCISCELGIKIKW